MCPGKRGPFSKRGLDGASNEVRGSNRGGGSEEEGSARSSAEKMSRKEDA